MKEQDKQMLIEMSNTLIDLLREDRLKDAKIVANCILQVIVKIENDEE